MVSTTWAAVHDVPEPSLLLLFGVGFIAVAGFGKEAEKVG
jgi:hypothetical protein